METPQLYRQLYEQVSQWVNPKDLRHLLCFAEVIAAILQAHSACLSHWLPFLSHRSCQARSHMQRLSYFVHNEHISAERFYNPLVRLFLQNLVGEPLKLTLDTSVLWEEFCLIEVCVVWGGRSITLAQKVLKHPSATVAFKDYQEVLEAAKALLPEGTSVTLLADRGFEHEALIRWLQQHQWQYYIRVKSDLVVQLANAQVYRVAQLVPDPQQAHLYPNVTVLNGIEAHLALANVELAKETWAVLSSEPVSIETFAIYGERFGGIEPHFKDYKSGAFNVEQTGLRDAQALTCLFMLLDCAALIAWIVALVQVQAGQLARLDWHGSRGLSFLQIGLREIARLCYSRLALPKLTPLPRENPRAACASKRKRRLLEQRIEFSKVLVFS